MNEEIVQYFVVNRDLNMSAGKVAAQVAHGATYVAMDNYNDETFAKWFGMEQKKIILKAKEKDVRKLLDRDIATYPVIDAGYTEIPPNSLTVVAFKPMEKTLAQPYVKRFQLY